ncbi:MAG: nucleotidyltransferase family protein [Defluviitaleaceae bacterium]|nr:nucleotidyltransferase family protein [Defluviitaleaceae bacterium]
MADICGIIAEYNPFHNGHLHQLRWAKKITGANAAVVALSGNFVQRGEAALIDKFRRTEAALHCGADMVLELPVPYATASAEAFALGGCRLLAATGMVDALCFGSESGDIAPLHRLATLLCNENADFKRILRQKLASGASFPAARAYALGAICPAATHIISSPNNILGIEYLKAIIKESLPLVPATSLRYGADHHATDFLQDSASASSIRKHVRGGGSLDALAPLMPAQSLDILRQEHDLSAINHIDNFSPFFHFALQRGTYGTSEGLQNRITAAARDHYLISHIIAAAKCKNHTRTAIQRAILHIILDISRQNHYAPIPYIRVLGFRRSRRDLLHKLHKTANLPVITNLKHTANLPAAAKTLLDMELAATKIYWLAMRPHGVAAINELATPMVIV